MGNAACARREPNAGAEEPETVQRVNTDRNHFFFLFLGGPTNGKQQSQQLGTI